MRHEKYGGFGGSELLFAGRLHSEKAVCYLQRMRVLQA
jgi:hypothetical protein